MRSKRDQKYTNLYVKRQLMQLEIDVFHIMTTGYAAKQSQKQILDQVKLRIQRYSVLLKLDQDEVNVIWARAKANYASLVRKTATKRSPDAIYRAIRAKVMKDGLIKDANRSMYQVEQREKDDEIASLLDSWFDSPFFLASSHPRPAHDHAAWEGKIYYDKDWKDKVDVDDESYAAVKEYIRAHRLRSVQWVTSAPVYFIRRPNCKHFFKNISIDEALGCKNTSDRAKLLDQKKMIHEADATVDRKVLYYRNYYNKLKILEKLWDTIPCKLLKYDILKTRALLDKWERMM